MAMMVGLLYLPVNLTLQRYGLGPTPERIGRSRDLFGPFPGHACLPFDSGRKSGISYRYSGRVVGTLDYAKYHTGKVRTLFCGVWEVGDTVFCAGGVKTSGGRL